MTIELSDQAKKDLKKIPESEGKKIARKLLLLLELPYLGKRLQGRLEDRYSLKAWPYRIIYLVRQDKKTIDVVAIEHRQGVYK